MGGGMPGGMYPGMRQGRPNMGGMGNMNPGMGGNTMPSPEQVEAAQKAMAEMMNNNGGISFRNVLQKKTVQISENGPFQFLF